MNKFIGEIIGKPALLEQLAEECNELSQSALKLARKLRGENPTPKTAEEILENFQEEVADVQLCLGELHQAGLYDLNEMTQMAQYKLTRWYKRLDASGKEITK